MLICHVAQHVTENQKKSRKNNRKTSGNRRKNGIKAKIPRERCQGIFAALESALGAGKNTSRALEVVKNTLRALLRSANYTSRALSRSAKTPCSHSLGIVWRHALALEATKLSLESALEAVKLCLESALEAAKLCLESTLKAVKLHLEMSFP